MDNPLPIGKPAPLFTLSALDGSMHSLEDYRRRITVINFWSAECPWAERADRGLVEYLESWGPQVSLLSIASNANESAQLITKAAGERRLPLVLLDPNQQAADLYHALATPHLFVVDPQGSLRYQGAFDDANFRQKIPTRRYLFDAVLALLEGRTPDHSITSPYGCAIVRQ